jgi:hypothetical protein
VATQCQRKNLSHFFQVRFCKTQHCSNPRYFENSAGIFRGHLVSDNKPDYRVFCEDELPKHLEFGLEAFERIINDLAFIQEKTNQVIRWTREITVAEVEILNQVVTILRTGQLIEKAKTVNFAVDKIVAQDLANLYTENEQIKLRFDQPDHSVNLLGTEISLGAVSIVLPNARPAQATLQVFQELNKLSDNEIVGIDLDIEEPGILVYYHEWLPKPETESKVDTGNETI